MALPMFKDDEEVKSALETCLSSVDHHGSFAAGGVVQNLINPGLEIDGLGRFGLPLSQSEVKRLIDCSRQAPFGKGNETIVDTSVRNTWEIDASKIQLQHPEWHEDELDILADICHRMGVPGGSQHVEAQLYKLLIYEKDAMFKPHKDTEKAPRMFGTLVVCLPCEHEGGNLVVSFNGKAQSFESAPTSKWSCSYFSWYADVLHEVKPITSGYRVVLTYNLVHTGHSALPDLVEQAERSSALTSTLTRWAMSWDMMDDREDGGWVPDHLIYMLDHEYTEANLRFDHLKGYDRKRVGAVVGLLEDTDMACYLCTVEKKVYGAVPGMCEELSWDEDDDEIHEIDEVYEEEFSISHVVELDGTLLAKNLAIEIENIVQPDWFNGRDPDEEDFGGWTGNEGASTTHWYRDAAVVIMPRDHALNFLLENGAAASEIRHIIQRAASKLDADPGNEEQSNYILQLCRRAKSKCYDDESVSLYTRIFLGPDRMDLFIDHVASGDKQLAPQVLAQLSSFMSSYGFERLRTSLNAATARYRTVGTRSEFLRTISANYLPRSDQDKVQYETWKHHQIDVVLAELGVITVADAPSLVTLTCERGNGKWVSNKLLPLIRHSGTSLAFALAIGDAVLPAIEKSKLDREVAVTLFREAASTAISKYNLDSKVQSEGSFCLTHTDLVNLHRILLQLGLKVEEDILLGRLEFLSASAEFGTFGDIILPYVRNLMQLVKVKNIPVPSDRHHGTFKVVFRRYIECLVPHNIRKSGDFIILQDLLLELHLTVEADMLMQRLKAHSGSLCATGLENILLPYIRNLIPMLKANHVRLDSGLHCGMIRALLKQYTVKCLPKEPTLPRFQLQALGCGCGECEYLDRFLLDPRQKVYHFSAVQKVRNHLRGRIEQEAGLTSAVQKGRHGGLRVTKRNGEYEHQKWKDVLWGKRQGVRSIASSDDLKLLLGDQYSQILQGLEPRTAAPISTAARNSETTTGLAPPRDLAGSQSRSEPVLNLPEPQRTRAWLEMWYEPDPSQKTMQDSVWQRYGATFKDDRGNLPPSSRLKDVLQNIFIVFPGAMPSTSQKGDPMIKGIRVRGGLDKFNNPTTISHVAAEKQAGSKAASSILAMSKDALLSLHLKLLGDTPTELMAFMGKLRHESAYANDSFFDNSLLPYLKGLVPLMKSQAIALHSEEYCKLFSGILDQYICRIVGQEPSPTTAWAQKKRGCGCADCRQLENFLTSSGQQIGRFTMNKERREHLQERLGVREGYGHADLDYTGHTERPEQRRMYKSFTLVVTKKPRPVGTAHKEWVLRCNVARKLLSNLAATQDLKMLLGDGYDGIVSLAKTKPPVMPAPELTQRTPLGPRVPNLSGVGSSQHVDGKTGVSAAKTGEKRKSDTDVGEGEKSAKRSSKTQVIDLSSSPGFQSM